MIEVKDLRKAYQARDGSPAVTVFDNIGFFQPKGEFLTVMGPSSCGKTTLLNVIAGFEKADAGTCNVNGRPVIAAGPDRGVVFQEYALFPWMTVEGNVWFALRAAGQWTNDSPARVDRILSRMGLAGFRTAYPKNLSGGMCQRVAIARLLAIDSPVMLMDEPFGALDALTRSKLHEELVELWSETGKTILFITHSVDESVFLADRILVMSERPARIALDLKIELPRPRDTTSKEFNEYKRELLNVINPAHKNTSVRSKKIKVA